MIHLYRVYIFEISPQKKCKFQIILTKNNEIKYLSVGKNIMIKTTIYNNHSFYNQLPKFFRNKRFQQKLSNNNL